MGKCSRRVDYLLPSRDMLPRLSACGSRGQLAGIYVIVIVILDSLLLIVRRVWTMSPGIRLSSPGLPSVRHMTNFCLVGLFQITSFIHRGAWIFAPVDLSSTPRSVPLVLSAAQNCAAKGWAHQRMVAIYKLG